MGTPQGRKRIPNQEKLTAEDDALDQIAREAEARLAAKRAARAEARDIRMKELERQQKEMSDDEEKMSVGSRGSLRVPYHPPRLHQYLRGPLSSSSSSSISPRASSARASPVVSLWFSGSLALWLSVSGSGSLSLICLWFSGSLALWLSVSDLSLVEERPDRDLLDKGSRTASTLSAATLASLGGASSRRGSCDTSVSVETEASIRDIKEVEERYRKAMVSNAQLHNQKTSMMFQELERQRQAVSVLQFQFREREETLRRSEALLT
ncbi:Leucine-rich repeat flightless-interacting protein 1, partial [Dissostichus eleginoides]